MIAYTNYVMDTLHDRRHWKQSDHVLTNNDSKGQIKPSYKNCINTTYSDTADCS